MRIFSAFFLLSFSLSIAFAFSVPAIIKDALFGRFLHSPYQDIPSIPLDFDFWRSLKDLGDKANTYMEKILRDAAAEYALAADNLEEFKKTMSQVVTSTAAVSTMLKDVPDLEELQNQFGLELGLIFKDLKTEVSVPLPENQTERYRQQVIMISRALDKIEDALVKVCGYRGIPEATVRTTYGDIKPHMNHVLLVVANLVNNHPDLLGIILLSAAIMVIPGIPILQLILRFFGFGPLGPIKGSIATSAQRFFFGGAVKEGSWFAMLQSAGMEGLVTKIIRAIRCFFWGSC